jgi:basic membrane protein A
MIKKLNVVAAALAMIVAACGGTAATTTAVTTPSVTEVVTTTAAPTTTTTAAPEPDPLDTNGDGQVLIGIAAAGPVDDGGYYQAVVDAAQQFAAEQGWAEPLVVDNIAAEAAATEIDNLAQQGVDVMIIGAGEIAAPMADLAAQYPDIFWYCNCGAGWPQSEFYAQSQDDGSEIHYTAGVAAGLLLQERGGDSMVMIGCCDLGFEKEAFLAMKLGLAAVDPSFTITYVPTGNFPFDFDNTAGATEALNNALAEGADGVYPFLGGALNPIGLAANGAGIFNVAAGPSDACSRTDVAWDMTVKFDGGDYVRAIFPGIVDGSVVEGAIKVFHVGVDPEPGAQICNPSAEAQAALDEAYALVASGSLNDQFGAIKGEAYAG